MKLYLFLLCGCVFFSLQADEPILHYDFSDPGIRKGGQFKTPEFVGNVEIDSEQDCIELQGKSYLSIPDSTAFSLLEGGTLFAAVKFETDSAKDGTDNAHDMLFFKNKSFLLAKDRGSLYFNLGDGKKCKNGIRCPVPIRKWCTVAVSVFKEPHNGKNYYALKIYINGELKKQDTWQFQGKDTADPVTFGKGWGGPWFMKGKVAEMRIYSVPISAAECKTLSENCLKKRVKQQKAK